MSFEQILLEHDGAVSVITLNRPAKLNSVTEKMHAELREALDEVEGRRARALVITGAGRAFCAGQDLGDSALRTNPAVDVGRSLDQNYNPLVKRLTGARFPVVGAINGIAAGAGANLALACDIVLAAKSATFLQAFNRIGLVPDAGGSWLLTHLVGVARAKGLAMLAEPLSAETAESWGLIWKAIDDASLMSEAMAMAHRLANQPTASLALIKKMIAEAAHNDLATQLDLEKKSQQEASGTADFREGVAAFLEKRKPVFRGE